MNIKKAIRRRVSAALGRPRNQRRFIDSSLGIAGFLRVMKEEDVNYVALRWFESLPEVAPGEDIDILVADNDVEIMTSYMKVAGKKGDIPCDIYSVSGLPGSSSRNMPYYPVPIGRKILEDAIWVNDLVRAPSPDDHFLSLSYHVVYHKGYAAGVPSEDEERNRKVLPCSDHDYVETLKRLGRESSLNLDDLDPTCRVPDDQIAYRSYPLLAARELPISQTGLPPDLPYTGFDNNSLSELSAVHYRIKADRR
ncbi:hypothetical protein [Halomonas sp. JS92-SW72]|uniref:hypothetical protein n=1 Tax=Halomonas sp. JS92-SW72 TaxID=2306583 RepID=UPI0013C30A8E|nr:hypothetical protein [Halomonas sp. JS92-SW72]